MEPLFCRSVMIILLRDFEYQLKKLLTHLENDWASRENGIGSKTLREYAERGRILTVGYICKSGLILNKFSRHTHRI